MKIGILQFPGSNCERETILAVERAGMHALPCLWNDALEKISSCDGYILVGGFSYEDRCRSGIIASLDPVMNIIKEQEKLGKPILGICNGAQILIESGLVPGVKENKVAAALATNKRIKNNIILGEGFYNNWVNIKISEINQNNAFTRHLLPNQPLPIPTAHAEGRFILAPGLFETLQQNHIAYLQYCDQEGKILNEFPTNPNGSENNLAAIGNVAGNVMAIMPHPERTINGDALFHSMRDYIQEQRTESLPTIDFKIEPYTLSPYTKPDQALEWIIDSIITDNAAASVQQALRNLNLNVTVSRQTHWEIHHHDAPLALSESLLSSSELFNPSKERLISSNDMLTENTISFLIQDKENLVGHKKQRTLKKYFNLNAITNIKQGILWNITAHEDRDMENIIKTITHRHILFNRFAHDCFIY